MTPCVIHIENTQILTKAVGKDLELGAVSWLTWRRPWKVARTPRPDARQRYVILRWMLYHEVHHWKVNVQTEVPNLHRSVESSRQPLVGLIYIDCFNPD